MKSSIAPAARSFRPPPVVRVDSHERGLAGVAPPALETAAGSAGAAEVRQFAGEAPARFRDYMGYHGHTWSSMESGAAKAHRRPTINERLGLIFGVTGFAGPGQVQLRDTGEDSRAWRWRSHAGNLRPTRVAGMEREAIPHLAGMPL